MGHLQRLLDRAAGATAAIRPRIDPWSPAWPVAEGAPFAEPETHASVLHPGSAAATFVEPRAPRANGAPVAERAVPARQEGMSANDRGPLADSDPGRPASTPAPAGRQHEDDPAVVREVLRELIIGEPSAVSGVLPVSPSPALAPRRDRRIETNLLVTPDTGRPAITPILPAIRRLPAVPREPDVIISIGRIEVRAPAAPARQSSRPAPRETDAERHQRYIHERLEGRGA